MEERYLAYKPNNLSSVSAIHVKVKETENDANLFSCSGTGAPLHTLNMHTYTINNLFLKEEMKGVGHSLMGSLVHSFNHFSQQIYMSSTICWLDVAINKNVKMYAFKETLFHWEDSKNTVIHKCVIH